MSSHTSWLLAPLAATIVTGACAAGPLADMERVAADPTPSPPAVESFLDELSIAVSWPADPAADSFLLERAEDSGSPAYSEVYRGGATRFVDSACSDQGRYLYRLSAIRGTKVFGPSAPALGVGSATCRDDLESNDSEETATALEYDRSANLYFYRSYDGAVVRDVDWYAVSVPPRRRANIVITQISPLPAGLATALIFYRKGSVPQPVTNSLAIAVDNTSYKVCTFLFELSPDPEEVLLDPSLAGGTTIDYTVSLASVVRL